MVSHRAYPLIPCSLLCPKLRPHLKTFRPVGRVPQCLLISSVLLMLCQPHRAICGPLLRWCFRSALQPLIQFLPSDFLCTTRLRAADAPRIAAISVVAEAREARLRRCLAASLLGPSARGARLRHWPHSLTVGVEWLDRAELSHGVSARSLVPWTAGVTSAHRGGCLSLRTFAVGLICRRCRIAAWSLVSRGTLLWLSVDRCQRFFSGCNFYADPLRESSIFCKVAFLRRFVRKSSLLIPALPIGLACSRF